MFQKVQPEKRRVFVLSSILLKSWRRRSNSEKLPCSFLGLKKAFPFAWCFFVFYAYACVLLPAVKFNPTVKSPQTTQENKRQFPSQVPLRNQVPNIPRYRKKCKQKMEIMGKTEGIRPSLHIVFLFCSTIVYRRIK